MHLIGIETINIVLFLGIMDLVDIAQSKAMVLIG
jgi:hypothetical protein